MKIMREYSVAFAEVSEILKIFPKEELNKIPKSFMDIIERCKDIDYKYELEDGVELHKQKMTNETKTILSVIYRDYICTEEEKAELIQEDVKESVLEEKQKRIKYNPDNIFKDKKIDKDHKIEETLNKDIINTENKLIKLKWYEKIVVTIKKWFNKF